MVDCTRCEMERCWTLDDKMICMDYSREEREGGRRRDQADPALSPRCQTSTDQRTTNTCDIVTYIELHCDIVTLCHVTCPSLHRPPVPPLLTAHRGFPGSSLQGRGGLFLSLPDQHSEEMYPELRDYHSQPVQPAPPPTPPGDCEECDGDGVSGLQTYSGHGNGRLLQVVSCEGTSVLLCMF